MDKKLYELEVERTKKLGNMTSALLMLATSMDALTKFCHHPPCTPIFSIYCVMLFVDVSPCTPNSVCAPGSPTNPPLPSSLPTMLYPR
jgi:hypothetical protein